jgi:MFS superfamily sulfate permease-like transporter
VDAEAVNLIDASACDALVILIKELRSQGITFAVARVRDHVRERLRLGGVEALVGSTNFHERVTDGVRACQQQTEQEARGPDGASTGPRGGA